MAPGSFQTGSLVGAAAPPAPALLPMPALPSVPAAGAPPEPLAVVPPAGLPAPPLTAAGVPPAPDVPLATLPALPELVVPAALLVPAAGAAVVPALPTAIGFWLGRESPPEQPARPSTIANGRKVVVTFMWCMYAPDTCHGKTRTYMTSTLFIIYSDPRLGTRTKLHVRSSAAVSCERCQSTSTSTSSGSRGAPSRR